MKFISSILMIYVLVLTLIPCSDHIGEIHTHDHNKVSHQNHEKEDTNGTEDSCTPFCTCSCCGISLTAASFHIFQLENPAESFNHTELQEKEYPLVTKYQENIWQPPQA
ncbi:DUF6660 family protein [Sphingobacterium cellulitidis]|nr:DUF6660 family protein [Sphingobacterium soli]MBA8986866.1 hypothetical protein [Sphingobacterium soli]